MPGYGFARDVANTRLDVEVNGTDVLQMTTSTITIPSGISLTISGTRLDGGHVAAHANDDTTGGIPVIYSVDTAGSSQTITVDHAIKVIDAWCIAEAAGGASDTITIDDGTNNITDAMDLNIVDTTIARAGTIDDAYSSIAAAGTLGITVASSADAEVFVLAVRTA